MLYITAENLNFCANNLQKCKIFLLLFPTHFSPQVAELLPIFSSNSAGPLSVALNCVFRWPKMNRAVILWSRSSSPHPAGIKAKKYRTTIPKALGLFVAENNGQRGSSFGRQARAAPIEFKQGALRCWKVNQRLQHSGVPCGLIRAESPNKTPERWLTWAEPVISNLSVFEEVITEARAESLFRATRGLSSASTAKAATRAL